jgi:hypothetical protein
VHFRKKRWLDPSTFSSKEAETADWLTALATRMIYLARPIVQDTAAPWQKPQRR